MILTKNQKSFLDNVVKGKWSINPDTELVEVNGDVYMSRMNLTEIPVSFGNVTGSFRCSDNQLTSLKGAPQSVGSSFYCLYNQLTSLEGAPQSVGSSFYCYYNQLTNLIGAPQSVGGYFYIKLNEIDEKYYHVIIPKIEEMIEMGIKIYEIDYYPYKEAYYNSKIIDVL